MTQPDRGAADQPAQRPEADPGHRRPAERARRPAAGRPPARSRRPWPTPPTSRRNDVSINQVGATWGSNVTKQGHPGPGHLLHRGDRLHLHPVRVQDGRGGHRRRVPRHPGRGRDLLDLPIPGDPGHGGGRADRARLLALRHRGGVRPDPGQLPGPRRVRAHHLLRDGQPLDEPDPGPVDQHLAGGHHPGALGPGHRLAHPRRHHPAELRPGPGHRAHQRCLLLDLHRLAPAGPHEGARAPLRHHPPAPRGPGRPWPGPDPGHGRGHGRCVRRPGTRLVQGPHGHRRDPARRRLVASEGRPPGGRRPPTAAATAVRRHRRRRRRRDVPGLDPPAGNRPPPRPRKGKGKGKKR